VKEPLGDDVCLVWAAGLPAGQGGAFGRAFARGVLLRGCAEGGPLEVLSAQGFGWRVRRRRRIVGGRRPGRFLG
jgi:hypothetical protein